jgi:hypothetical protein
MFRFTKDFAKEYKYTVGESLKKETIELITLIYPDNSRTDKQETLQTDWFRKLFCAHSNVFRNYIYYAFGFSVRCLKD